MNGDNNGKKCVFIDSSGGSGKSYLLNSLISYLKKIHIAVLFVTQAGITANLLIDGITSHIASKFTLNITEATICNIKPNSENGKELREVKIVIWDKVSMTPKYTLEAIDRLFCDLCNTNEIFGGKIIILQVDFRQTLLVVKHVSRTQITENCITNSKLWNEFKQITKIKRE